MNEVGALLLIIALSVVGLWIIFYFVPLGLWFQALVSGVRISLLQLIFMRWRKVPPRVIVQAMIEGTKAGLTLNRNEMEAHFLAGGRVSKVVHALVSAQRPISPSILKWQLPLTLPAAMYLKLFRCR